MRLGPEDAEFVARLLGIPAEKAIRYLLDPEVVALSPLPGCLFFGQPLFPGAVSFHQFAEPGSRGATMVTAAKQANVWLWKNTTIDKVVGFTPATHRAACVMASMIGMRREGLLTAARRDEGGLHDVVVYGLSRQEGGRQ